MLQFRAIKDKSQLVDALTGAPLQGDACECGLCGVFYNRESVEALKADNEGNCAACGRKFEAVKQ